MAEAEQVAVPETKKKSKLMLWLVITIVVLLLGGGGFLGWRYFIGANPASADAKSGGTSASTMGKVKSMMNMDAFLVNLADMDAARFVKVTFRLGLDESKLGEEYSSDPVILAATRDRIISLLGTKTSDEMLTPEGKEQLRKEIREKVNEILPKGKVVEVFIMDFVVQL
jgi:flagellar FliL protein